MVQQNKTRSWGHRLREENSTLKEKIADLRKENARLRKDLEKTWELMAHVPGGLFLLQRETIAYANEAASRWLGYNPGELVGKNLLDILDPDDAPTVLEFIRSRAGTKTPETMRFKNSVGESVYCAVHLKKTRYEGRNAFLVNVIEIEGKIEKEKNILEARKFEALRKMAGAFARELEIISTPGHPLFATLMDFSRETYPPSELSRLNLNDVIEETVTRYCSLNGIHDGQLSNTEDPIRFKSTLNVSSPLNGCRKDLQNAFMSLIRNAVEALEEKGDIYVTAQEKPGMIHIYVQENGCGMHENVVDRIFDPFFTTKGGEHKGLGLSVARSIVERHGGKINVVRHDAGGTTFHVNLPLDHRAFEANDPSPKKSIKEARILLLGDQNILLNLLYRFLSSKHFLVTRLDNYGECFKTLKGDSFDLLLVDHWKSGSKTPWLVSKVRQTNPDMAIVLFNVSKSDGTGSLRTSGVDLALTKPLHLERLYSSISRILTAPRS